MIKNGRFTLFCMVWMLMISQPVSADLVERFQTGGQSIYLLHALAPPHEVKKAAITDLVDEDHAHLTALSMPSKRSPLLPVDDIDTMVRRIDRLTEAFEIAKDGEGLQRLQFEIAYEYFLLYLHFQKIKYGPGADENVPVSENELKQYLMLSRHYLSPFMKKTAVPTAARTPHRVMDNVTFPLRDNPEHSLNVHFLSMMIETECLAGEWKIEGIHGNGLADETQTWHWLETLWRQSHSLGGQEMTPASDHLFDLYDLYLRYHFLGRSLRHETRPDPLIDMRTRTLLGRLRDLAGASDTIDGTLYAHYAEEANMDSGNTRFLVNLYLARRGFALLNNDDAFASKAEVFQFFKGYYDRAAEEIHYNIPLRKKIYNELILMGVQTGNLRLMEDVLYQYGLMAMHIPGPEKRGRFIEESSRHTMAYLLANILDKKRISGLWADSGQYAEMARTLAPGLASRRHSYWRYASVIHRCLAEYHSNTPGDQSEALAIYHSRKAFLTLCKKLSLNGQTGDWTAFQKMPGANHFLGLFLYYQKKYPTSPHASIPHQYNAQKIIAMRLKQKDIAD